MAKAKKKVKDLDPKAKAKKVKGGTMWTERDTKRAGRLVVDTTRGIRG